MWLPSPRARQCGACAPVLAAVCASAALPTAPLLTSSLLDHSPSVQVRSSSAHPALLGPPWFDLLNPGSHPGPHSEFIRGSILDPAASAAIFCSIWLRFWSAFAKPFCLHHSFSLLRSVFVFPLSMRAVQFRAINRRASSAAWQASDHQSPSTLSPRAHHRARQDLFARDEQYRRNEEQERVHARQST